MSSARVSRIHRALTAALVTIYLAAGIAGFFADFDDTGDAVIWIALLCGGASLILLGTILRGVARWVTLTLVSIGALAGGIALVWTVLVPIAAALLIALTFSLTRREPATVPPE